jgi:hypothetical protein
MSAGLATTLITAFCGQCVMKKNRTIDVRTAHSESPVRPSVIVSQALGPDELNDAIVAAIQEREREHAARMHELRRKARILEDMLVKARQLATDEELARIGELRALGKLLQENDEP